MQNNLILKNKEVVGMKELKVCWVSAGVSSFMAGWLAGDVDEWIYIDIDDQHKDSMRFIKDIEKAIGKNVEILRSEQYKTVEECVCGMGYWNRIRKDFPEVFEARSILERKVGYSILRDCYLDELDPNRGNMNTEIFPDCGIMCYLAEK